MNTELQPDVPVQIAGADISTQVHTRSVTAITTGSMGVFRLGANGYSALYNIQYSYTSGWTSATPVQVGGANASLCAYYPYGAAAFNANSTTCTLTAQKYDAGKDLCYATTGGATVCNKTPGASFAMKRAYARIKLSIQRYAGSYKGNCNITDVVLQAGAEFCRSQTLDISSGTTTGAATPGGWKYALNSGNIADGATYTGYDVLVPPQPVGSGLTITLNIDGKNRAVTVAVSQFSGGKINAGQQYTISMTIYDTKVSVNGNVNVTDMTAGDNLQNGTVIVPAESMLGDNCSGNDQALLSKLVWAKGNLRQQGDDGSGPTIMAGPTDRGHYYTFNSVYTGNTDQRGGDPCKDLAPATYGTGWRTPSYDEMDALSRCTDKVLTNGGMWFMNSTKGLFLPAAGYRGDNVGSGTTPTSYPGSNGDYWSSDADGSDYGYCLDFGSGYADIYGLGNTDGFSVRCVRGI